MILRAFARKAEPRANTGGVTLGKHESRRAHPGMTSARKLPRGSSAVFLKMSMREIVVIESGELSVRLYAG